MSKVAENMRFQQPFASDGDCIKCGDRLGILLHGCENPAPDEAGEDVIRPCPDCFPDKFERLKQKYRLIFRQQRAEKLLKASQLTPKFLEKTFENFKIYDHRQERVVMECQNFAEGFPAAQEMGSCLLFMGPCGTGKGHLSASIVHRVVELHEVTVLFEKYIDLVNRVKHSWRPESEESDVGILQSVRAPDLLILDEIGVSFQSEFERMILYQIIDHRCEYLRPTVLTTNYELEELKRVVGERVYDRLLNQESGNKVLAFNWKSYRQTLGG